MKKIAWLLVISLVVYCVPAFAFDFETASLEELLKMQMRIAERIDEILNSAVPGKEIKTDISTPRDLEALLYSKFPDIAELSITNIKDDDLYYVFCRIDSAACSDPPKCAKLTASFLNTIKGTGFKDRINTVRLGFRNTVTYDLFTQENIDFLTQDYFVPSDFKIELFK